MKVLIDRAWLVGALAASPIALLFSGSIYIAGALSALIFGLGLIRSTNATSRTSYDLDQIWPEVIDHLISGIQSGMSLTESFLGLQERGPLQLRPYISRVSTSLTQHGDFELTLKELKKMLANPSSDQICEAISLSRTLGGSELIVVLRALGEFLRTDLATRREIDVKHAWIKNSAHLSAIAPWLLLLLLSTQSATARAFATPTGITILLSGVVMTCLAYIWMNHLARLPRPPRVFGDLQ